MWRAGITCCCLGARVGTQTPGTPVGRSSPGGPRCLCSWPGAGRVPDSPAVTQDPSTGAHWQGAGWEAEQPGLEPVFFFFLVLGRYLSQWIRRHMGRPQSMPVPGFKAQFPTPGSCLCTFRKAAVWGQGLGPPPPTGQTWMELQPGLALAVAGIGGATQRTEDLPFPLPCK